MPPAVVDILERCYHVDRAPTDWLEDVTRALSAHTDQGLGVSAYFLDASAKDSVGYESFVAPGQDVEAARGAFEQWQGFAPLWFQRAIHLSVPCGFASELPR